MTSSRPRSTWSWTSTCGRAFRRTPPSAPPRGSWARCSRSSGRCGTRARERCSDAAAGRAPRAAAASARPALHDVRRPVAGARHRRQHRDLQLVARGPVLPAPRRVPARAARDPVRPRPVGKLDGPVGRGGRPAGLAHVRRVRGAARRCYGLRDPDGLAVQPRELAGLRRRRRLGIRQRAAGVGRVLPGTRRATSHRTPVHARGGPGCGAGRRHQPRLLAAPLRGPAGRARPDAHRPEDVLRHHRCRIARVHRRDRRAAARLLAAPARAAPRAAGHRPAARHPARQGDVAARVREAQARRRPGAGGSRGQRGVPGRPGILLWRPRHRATAQRVPGPAAPCPGGLARRVGETAGLLAVADGAAGGGGRAVADRVREPRHAPAGAGRGPPARGRPAPVLGRHARAARPPARDGEPDAGDAGRRGGPRGRLRVARPARADAGAIRLGLPDRLRAGSAGPGVPRRRDGRRSGALRAAPRLAGHAHGSDRGPQARGAAPPGGWGSSARRGPW